MYILTGLSVHQSKSDSIRNGIIMNGANETEDSGNTALADGSIDKSAITQRSVGDVIRPINGSTQQQQPQQIELRKYRMRKTSSIASKYSKRERESAKEHLGNENIFGHIIL